ncbi:chaplin [Streptomyces sp. NPDC001070]
MPRVVDQDPRSDLHHGERDAHREGRGPDRGRRRRRPGCGGRRRRDRPRSRPRPRPRPRRCLGQCGCRRFPRHRRRNVIQIPVSTPVNLCGNTVDFFALLNPALGNACVNA